MSATPELSRFIAKRVNELGLDPDTRAKLAAAAEKAGTYVRLAQKWQRLLGPMLVGTGQMPRQS